MKLFIYRAAFRELPRVRVTVYGPSRGVVRRLLHRSEEHLLFDADVAPRVTDELRPGVSAQWSDPRERWR